MRNTRLRHSIRSLRRLFTAKDAKAVESAVPATFSVIDKSAKLGIIKKNTAARYKSRIALRLKKMVAAA